MKRYNSLSNDRLQEILDRFSDLRIGVAGDFFLDKYLEIDPAIAEVSLETGKTAHQVVKVRHSPGAAGNVVNNLAALGAGTLYAIGFTGDDGESYDLRKDLAKVGCSIEHLHCDPERMTP
ncbi:MAG TPA: PfkB family carbohydrate kinase, partial [Spirochaetia bacterium]|nr:PfkB family carbohydrate kinase [Spirochaetia bacterium]